MTKTNSFSLFWDHDKVGTYEVKKTETNMHRQHTGSVGLLAPGSTATEKYVLSRHPITVTMATLPCLLLKWVLRSDYKHFICDLFHHRMYKLCLKMAFMHLLQLYLFKYLPLSISVHMTQAYWTFMHATCVHPLSCDAHWPLQIIWKWYYWLVEKGSSGCVSVSANQTGVLRRDPCANCNGLMGFNPQSAW